jgi:uncharacterized protein (DUF983 family)
MLKGRCPRCGGNLFFDQGVANVIPSEIVCIQCGFDREIDNKQLKVVLVEGYNGSNSIKKTRV